MAEQKTNDTVNLDKYNEYLNFINQQMSNPSFLRQEIDIVNGEIKSKENNQEVINEFLNGFDVLATYQDEFQDYLETPNAELIESIDKIWAEPAPWTRYFEDNYISVPDDNPNYNVCANFASEKDRYYFQELVTRLAVDNDCKVFVSRTGIKLHDKEGNEINMKELSPDACKQLRQLNRIWDRTVPGKWSEHITTTESFNDYAVKQYTIMAENEAYLEQKHGGKILYGEGGAVFMGPDGQPITLTEKDQIKLNDYRIAREKYERMEQAQADRRTKDGLENEPIISEEDRRRICLDSANEARAQLTSEGKKPKENDPRDIFDHGTYGVTFETENNRMRLIDILSGKDPYDGFIYYDDRDFKEEYNDLMNKDNSSLENTEKQTKEGVLNKLKESTSNEGVEAQQEQKLSMLKENSSVLDDRYSLYQDPLDGIVSQRA